MRTMIASIDCGTTAVKAAVFDLSGAMKGFSSRPCPCRVGAGGRIEQSPRLIVKLALSCLEDAAARARARPASIAALSFSGQRATVICADSEGEAIGGAISWQDLRGGKEIERLRRAIPDRCFYRITGLPNNPVFSLGKILHLKRTDPGLYRRTSRFMLVNDYVLGKMGCREFLSDWSNASLTGLMDVRSLRWSGEILECAGLAEGKLAELVPPGTHIGALSRAAARRCGLPAGTPLVAGAGDQQCAALGAGCVRPGRLMINLGTAAASAAFAAGPVMDPRRRVACTAHAVPHRWCVEGLQSAAGASLEWLQRIVAPGARASTAFYRSLAYSPPRSDGVFFHPYLAGASAPHWNPAARGMFTGLAHGHGASALARAVMEGVSMETRQIIDVFSSLGLTVREIRLAGGGSSIPAWNRMQADILGRSVATLRAPQVSLLGAAILAGVGAGVFGSCEEAAARMVRIEKAFSPAAANVLLYRKRYRRFCALYEAAARGGFFRPQ